MADHGRWLAVWLVVAAGACGGSDDSAIFGAGSGGASGAGAAGQGGTAGSGGTGGSGGAATGGLAGVAGAPDGALGGASGASGSASDGGGSGGDAGKDGGDGGPGPGVGTGPCGSAVCAFSAGDECCVPAGGTSYCSNDALQNPCVCSGVLCHKVQISCDGAEDCKNQICCAERGLASSGWDILHCAVTCMGGITTTRHQVCHVGGSACPNGSACEQDAGLPAGYGTCNP
jgi:hypothetical protein